MSMLHGVEVDVVEMAFKVFDFFDRMFPGILAARLLADHRSFVPH